MLLNAGQGSKYPIDVRYIGEKIYQFAWETKSYRNKYHND